MAVTKKPAAKAARKSDDGESKLRLWSDKEVQMLKELYPTMSNADIAKKLKRPKASVDKKGFDYGLKKSKDYRREVAKKNNSFRKNSWKPDEIKTLKQYYKTKTYKELAKILKRNPQSIQSKATKLGLWKYTKSE
jgi:hypothetical protein